MSGNVWEWCQDRYGFYNSASQNNPVGPSSGAGRVYRGSGWSYDAGIWHITIRCSSVPENRINNLGLRLALSDM